MGKIREAVAVLLWRGRGAEREVYLVRRNERLRFFGGSWACPGGVVDEADRAAVDEAVGSGMQGVVAPWAVMTAARELFEETGVAPGDVGFDGATRSDLRRRLLGEVDGAAHEALERFGRAARSAFAPLGRLLTPPFAPVRYATDFVACELPPTETCEIWPGELTDGEWRSPAAWLETWRRGERPVVPPVVFLLELLDGRDDAAFHGEVRRRFAGLDQGDLHPVRFSPGIMTVPQATATLPPATTTNCSIVGQQRLLVIDPAGPDVDEQQRLAEHLRRTEDAGASVEAILLTHHHPDHVGGVAALHAALGCPVFAHAETWARVAPELRSVLGRAARSLEGGEQFELGTAPDGSSGWSLEVHWTPGHAPGHLAFRETRYGAWIAGDLVSTMSTIVIDPEDGHLATYLESLERVASTPDATLHPSHGPAHRSSHAIIDQYRIHRAQREAKLVAALTDVPKPLDELLVDAYDDVDPRALPLARRSLHAGLIKLAEERRAASSAQGWSLAAADH